MTTATKINVKLLNQILDLIETNPHKWEQGSWITSSTLTDEQVKQLNEGQVELCGTQACVAGWAMLLSKEWQPVLEGAGASVYVTDMMRKSDGLTPSQIGDAEFLDTDQVYINTGAELLGLDIDQARQIFLNMEYDPMRPKTFTDQVRHFLSLPVKHGTKFDCPPGHRDAEPLSYPKGETDKDINDTYAAEALKQNAAEAIKQKVSQ